MRTTTSSTSTTWTQSKLGGRGAVAFETSEDAKIYIPSPEATPLEDVNHEIRVQFVMQRPIGMSRHERSVGSRAERVRLLVTASSPPRAN